MRNRHPVLFLALLLSGFLSSTPGKSPAQSAADPAHLYNQACRLSLKGDLDQALETLQLAFAAGFDDFRFALDDPDLAALRPVSGFADLITARQSTLHLLSREKGIDLSFAAWSDPVTLSSDQGIASPPPQLRLRWLAEGLEFELQLEQEFAAWPGDKVPAPWNGGPGLVLTLSAPDTLSAFESRANFIMAFGLEKSSPVGAMYADRLGWQRVLELDPQVKIDASASRLTMTGRVPWQSIQPFHPLVDEDLGFNAAVRSFTPEGQVIQASLLPDPRAFQPRFAVRRSVPLEFFPDARQPEALTGRIDSSLNRARPLKLELAAISHQDGQARLTIDFTDNQGQSLLPGGVMQSAVSLKTGMNRLVQDADFSRLKMGLYTVRAELTFPSGLKGTWSTRVLQLGPDWESLFATRIAALPAREQPTARYFLSAIEQAVDRLPPRQDPGAIATTLGDLDRLLTRHAQTGTLVPEQGTVLLVYPGPDGEDRLCTLYLPEGYRARGPLNPVVLLNPSPGFEPRLVQRLARSYEFEGHLTEDRRTTTLSPLYLIPHAVKLQGDVQTQALAEAQACLDWARAFFTVDQVSVCGVDFSAGAALRLSADPEENLHALMIMAGAGLDPWPLAEDSFLRQQLQGLPRDLPITWLDFIQETRTQGQGPQLLRVLQGLGCRFASLEEVRGGVSLTQVADRLVLWAEGLP